jgi:hypothetical protein
MYRTSVDHFCRWVIIGKFAFFYETILACQFKLGKDWFCMHLIFFFFWLISNIDFECPSSDAESVELECESNKDDVSSSANEPELSLLDDILSVESGGSTLKLDGMSGGGGKQLQQVTSSNVYNIFAFLSAPFTVGCAFQL